MFVGLEVGADFGMKVDELEFIVDIFFGDL
jgi:hypothetical protein